MNPCWYKPDEFDENGTDNSINRKPYDPRSNPTARPCVKIFCDEMMKRIHEDDTVYDIKRYLYDNLSHRQIKNFRGSLNFYIFRQFILVLERNHSQNRSKIDAEIEINRFQNELCKKLVIEFIEQKLKSLPNKSSSPL